MNQIQRHKEQRKHIATLVEECDGLLINNITYLHENVGNPDYYTVSYYETETIKLRSITFERSKTTDRLKLVHRH